MGWAVFIGRECKGRRTQSVKIKTNGEQLWKLTKKTKTVKSYKKGQFSQFCETNPTWVISCSCLWKLWVKHPKVDMRQPLVTSFSFKKIPVLPVFYKSGMYGNLFQPLSFIFLRTHAKGFSFYTLQFYFRLKFFHSSFKSSGLDIDSSYHSSENIIVY